MFAGAFDATRRATESNEQFEIGFDVCKCLYSIEKYSEHTAYLIITICYLSIFVNMCNIYFNIYIYIQLYVDSLHICLFVCVYIGVAV